MTSLVKKRNITVIVLLYVIMVSLVGCSASQETEKSEPLEKANHLINETSPYLLQHAHNPVDWYPWGKEALDKAKKENKLLLISVGYAACHWCHVMERESFEDEEVAQIMNANFVCIKVDREERQDIDQIYMNAVQLITGSGGWPLNCFALPDGRPFYGGTYFAKESWKDILQRVSKEYQESPEKVKEYAERLTEGVAQSELIVRNESDNPFERKTLKDMVEPWKAGLDFKEGGFKGAPKFPMPNNLQFLLKYSTLTNDEVLNEYVQLSLNKMAFGGLYDHVGGGFTRYSTDKKWKVPHFEKMLYDNGQMISLYAEAYLRYKDPEYKNVVQKTIAFCNRELSNGEGVYYSSLDADSEGEEGRYYVWEDTEFKKVLADDYPVMKSYYNMGGLALWEDGRNILFRSELATQEAKKHGISEVELEQVVKRANKALFEVRQNRVAPGLDDKSLTSWNAIMMTGLIDAYEAFDDSEYLINAKKTGKFLAETQRKSDGGLFHSYKNGKSSINGFLEDYSFTIEAFLKMYQVTFDTYWLEEAKILVDYSMDHFYQKESGMFYFTSDLDPALIARKMEVNDNVIPSSNSSLAKGLFQLGTIYDNAEYLNTSYTMLNNVQGNLMQYGSNYSNWGQLMIKQVFPHYVVAIVGNDALQKRKELRVTYVPNKMIIGSLGASKIPLLDGKLMNNETLFYVCVNKACKMPTLEVEEAISQMK